ncbi:MAG: adenosylcobinamide-phosphate synthase CbiB, partial [Natrialbaceae archaeon]
MSVLPDPAIEVGGVPAVSLTVVAAFAFERLLGEPPTRVHPVVWFGRLVGWVDSEWDRPGTVGGAIALALPLGAAAGAFALVAGSWRLDPLLGVLGASLVLFVSTSLTMLLNEGRAVVAASSGDLSRARERLPALAGRDPDELGPAEIRSAAVESVAENLADGLLAPLLAFSVLAAVSLPLAAAAAAWVKAVNTLDSMLGYPGKPHGTASARLDDLVMWLPARVSALFVALAAADPGAFARARGFARVPPSPNSGWPMATLACALGVRLEKPGVYTLNPGAALPTPADG